MNWKKLGTWRTTYVWMTYILPHLRYGSLIFREKLDNENNPYIDKSTKEFTKIYNATIKRMYNLSKSTPNVLINKIMGSWSAKAAIVQNQVRNSNLWLRNYEFEINDN